MKVPARGFALVIVSVCGVAMTAIALALVFTAGSQKILSTKGAAIDHATTIADSGMERAVAYLGAVAGAETDFDAALDPALNTDCDSNPTVRPRGTPRYNDGNSVQDADGTWYRRVGFNRGAYFTRFDDDQDDDMPLTVSLAPTTGNNDNANNCREGAAFPGQNNPHRDRNRSVWITVIGVYPDAPLTSAKNRITLRRFYTSTESDLPPVTAVSGNVTIGNGATLRYCSDQGGMALGGNLTISGALEQCGAVVVDGTVTGGATNPTNCGSVGCTPRGPLSANASVTLPAAPSVTDQGWVRQAEECTFLFIDTDPSRNGIYWWDGNGTRVSGPCADFSPLLTDPMEASDWTGSNPRDLTATHGRSCWVPLILVGGGGLVNEGVATNELCTPALDGWCPVSGNTVAGAGPFSALGHAWNGITLLAAPSKKDFGTCAGIDVEFRPGGPPETCVGACDGSRAVMRWAGGRWRFSNQFDAYPTGAYLYGLASGTNYILNMDPPAVMPADDSTAAQWPLMTLIVRGNMTVNDDGIIGVGSSAPPGNNPTGGLLGWPALLVDGNLTLANNVDLRLGGSLFVAGDTTLGNNAALRTFGQIAIDGALTLGNNSLFAVLHDDEFANVPQEVIITSASTSKTVR